MKICVFGAASNKIDKLYIEKVEQLGELLGEKGHKLVFGAGKEGLMGAVARGIAKKSAEIIGVLPSFFLDENIEATYEKCTQLIQTKTMRERKAIMEDISDAFIIVPGGIGTFEEFFEIVTLKQLGRHKKPIVIYNINKYYDNMQEMMEHSMREGFVREQCNTLYSCYDSAIEVVEYIENYKDFDMGLDILKRN